MFLPNWSINWRASQEISYIAHKTMNPNKYHVPLKAMTVRTQLSSILSLWSGHRASETQLIPLSEFRVKKSTENSLNTLGFFFIPHYWTEKFPSLARENLANAPESRAKLHAHMGRNRWRSANISVTSAHVNRWTLDLYLSIKDWNRPSIVQRSFIVCPLFQWQRRECYLGNGDNVMRIERRLQKICKS